MLSILLLAMSASDMNLLTDCTEQEFDIWGNINDVVRPHRHIYAC